MLEEDLRACKGFIVGYKLVADDLSGPDRIERVGFDEAIAPYLDGCETPRQLYLKLQARLAECRGQQDEVIGGKRAVSVSVLAVAALEREVLANTMSRLRSGYFQ